MSRLRRLRDKPLALAACSILASFVWYCVALVSYDPFVSLGGVAGALMLGAAGLALVLGLAGVRMGKQGSFARFVSAVGALIGAGLLLITIVSLSGPAG